MHSTQRCSPAQGCLSQISSGVQPPSSGPRFEPLWDSLSGWLLEMRSLKASHPFDWAYESVANRAAELPQGNSLPQLHKLSNYRAGLS